MRVTDATRRPMIDTTDSDASSVTPLVVTVLLRPPDVDRGVALAR